MSELEDLEFDAARDCFVQWMGGLTTERMITIGKAVFACLEYRENLAKGYWDELEPEDDFYPEDVERLDEPDEQGELHNWEGAR